MIAATGFLEVCNKHTSLFDSPLHMFKGDYELHTVRLAECDDVQDQMNQFGGCLSVVEDFGCIDLYIALLLVLSGLLKHTD